MRSLLALGTAALAAAAPAHYEVTSLPGWDGPLLSKAYCGFSSAGVPPSGVGEMFFNYICAYSTILLALKCISEIALLLV